MIADLDNNQFAVREKATGDLQKLGQRAELALRRALAGQPTPEAKRRLDKIVQSIRPESLPPESLRTLRGIEILEHIGTPDAGQVLQKLAGGAPKARITQEAKASLSRLAGRGNKTKLE